MDTAKMKLKVCIDDEHGKKFSRNINLSEWTFTKGDSFISFRLKKIEGVETAIIEYVYITKKQDLIKLLSFCINFWAGNKVRFIYLLEHRREATYLEKYLGKLGFTVLKEKRDNVWKYKFEPIKYKENEIIEYYI